MAYDEMFALVQAGEITADDWFQFCFKVLADILEENKNVMIRLKYR